MRKLVWLLALLALLLVVDRAGAAYAGRTLAGELQRAGALPQRPAVDVGGFPFLTQVVRGSYERVEVAATGVTAGDTTVARLDAVLTGARVPLGQAVSGTVTQVPVERVEARVLLPYEELGRSTGERRLTLAPAGDRVRVRGEVEVLGQRLTAAAVSTVTLEGDAVVVTAQSFEVGNGLADALLTRALQDRFDLRVPVRDLPYGLVVQSVAVEPEGVVVRSTATDTVLSVP